MIGLAAAIADWRLAHPYRSCGEDKSRRVSNLFDRLRTMPLLQVIGSKGPFSKKILERTGNEDGRDGDTDLPS